METVIKDLTLVLLYLTSRQEDAGLAEVRRSWKGYPFEVLNGLEEEGLITGGRRAKSVCFTEEGEGAARALLEQYGIASRMQTKTMGRVIPHPKSEA